jgi:hypothetical protein
VKVGLGIEENIVPQSSCIANVVGFASHNILETSLALRKLEFCGRLPPEGHFSISVLPKRQHREEDKSFVKYCLTRERGVTQKISKTDSIISKIRAITAAAISPPAARIIPPSASILLPTTPRINLYAAIT